MPLTKEQLLIPRYKVAATWPGMEVEPFRLHEIVTLTWHLEDDGEAWIHRPVKHILGSYMRQGFFEKYPHLFQPLPWWSDRKPEDMPMFIKYGTIVLRVSKWLKGIADPLLPVDESGNSITALLRYSHALPATEEEYTAYINQKQQ